MPSPGTKPKAEAERITRHRLTHDWIEVPDVPCVSAPGLPPGRWSAKAKRWWDVVSRMPHASLWKDSDWLFVEATLELVAAFYRGAQHRATEIRQREALLGVTADQRRDLRIRYVQPKDLGDGEILDLDAFREEISG